MTENYRELASVCLALAKRTVDPQDRQLLLNVASKWLELARGASAFTWPAQPDPIDTCTPAPRSVLSRRSP